MAVVGDRIAVASKGEPRSGVVTAVNGAMFTVLWDTGSQTSLIPGPGVLSVTSRPRTPSARARRTTSGATAAASKTSAAGSRRGVARKAAPGQKAAAADKSVAKKAAPGKKAAAADKSVAKKAAPGRKPVKRTSSSRTAGKKTR